MTETELKEVRAWHTKLKTKEVDTDSPFFPLMLKETWIVTEFARNLKDEFRYVVQAWEKHGLQEGVTGMSAYVLTEEEFKEFFEVQNEK